MQIQILNHLKIPDLPSGSGLVRTADRYYAVGDDSPYLFSLNNKFEIISKILLIESSQSVPERIIKGEKSDFESLEMINEKEMVVFGSGSKSPQRDVFVRIRLPETIIIDSYHITAFYDHLRRMPELRDSELNIEATAYHNGNLYLFNRKKNLILKFNYEKLLNFILEGTAFPPPEIREFKLPAMSGIEAGFSGATAFKYSARIIFTASVENTSNAYDDGEILGSLIGCIYISRDTISDVIDYCFIPNSTENFKVESVIIIEEISDLKTKVALITDDDLGNSILIETDLLW